MNTIQLSNLQSRSRARSSFFRNMFLSAIMLALLLSSLPAQAVLAAGNSYNTKEMQQEWDNKVQKVEYNSIFYQRVRVYPADFEDLDELAVAHDLLNQYGVALLAAQRIVFNHTGFDAKGKVTNERLADQSLKDLGENLRLMRVYKEKLGDLKGDYRLLPMSALTTTAP